MNNSTYTREQVIAANVAVHTAATDVYANEPHYRAENRARVREILKSLKQESGGTRLLDVGCGAGFIIDIASEFFDVIRGVDITPAMLAKIKPNRNADIKLEVAPVEALPFPDNMFDVCSAHALLHHLHDVRPALREVARVLKPGGLFYADLDPNAYFWDAIKGIKDHDQINNIIQKEVNAVTAKDQEIAEQLQLDVELIRKSEHLKHVQGGFREEALRSDLEALGFSDVRIQYQWFIGEVSFIHESAKQVFVQELRSYLRDYLPLTRHLFKYLSFIAKIDK